MKHILLTNDDGIHAPGIKTLYKYLSKIAKVYVVAPDTERSSIGHAITLAHPIFYRKIPFDGRSNGYALSGTPADCVKFGIKIILNGKKPDLVVSGINLGDNEGCSVFYSGTVAGAREGALNAIPSMAVSLATYSSPNFNPAAQYATRIAENLLKNKIAKGTFLNINVPAVSEKSIKGIKATAQGVKPIHSKFYKRQDPFLRDYYWMSGKPISKQDDNSVDTFALRNNYVTVTPIQTDTTNYKTLNDLKNWEMLK